MTIKETIKQFISQNNFEVLNYDKIAKYYIAINSTLSIFSKIAMDDANIEITVDKNQIFKVLKDYDKVAKCVKKTMFGDNEDMEHIDSHKIASIFLVAILKNDKFVIAKRNQQVQKSNIVNDRSTYEEQPAIYFSYILGIVIMEAMYNIGKQQRVIYSTDKAYGVEFAKMIYANKDAIISPAKSDVCSNTAKGIFCLSHIFYFIEKSANKKPHNLIPSS